MYSACCKILIAEDIYEASLKSTISWLHVSVSIKVTKPLLNLN